MLGAARRLEGVRLVAAMQGVALVHDLGEHGPAIAVDPDVPVAALALVVPPRGERHDALRVPVVLAVALRRVAAVSALAEVVERHDGLGVLGDRRRATVREVEVPGLAAFSARVARPRTLQRAARLALFYAVSSGAGAETWKGDEQEACQKQVRGTWSSTFCEQSTLLD
ncbi:hypothetical protein HU200_008418 [Digitaria exilis]|uniref:Uncharacterized protein n=1 Tax=Digitaria exilis TaxID=1010633 RepID=A0A835FLK2_9POAL|nr:hypothetical protein HU200_008418 [Digitaria exilis]